MAKSTATILGFGSSPASSQQSSPANSYRSSPASSQQSSPASSHRTSPVATLKAYAQTMQHPDDGEWEIVKRKQKPIISKPKIEPKLYQKDELVQLIKDTLQPYNPYALYLFGSYSLGKATVNSDVDIMVIWNKCVPSNIVSIKEELIHVLGKYVDLINMIYVEKMVEDDKETNRNFLDIVYAECIPIINEQCIIKISQLIGKTHSRKR